MSNIKNIAFDLGGVVLALSYEQAATALGMLTLCPHDNEDWIQPLEQLLK